MAWDGSQVVRWTTGGKDVPGGGLASDPAGRASLSLEGPAVGPLGPSQMTEEKHLNIKKRAVGLLATAGLVGGLFTVAAPAAHAVTVGACTGTQFLGTLTPPLAA